MGLPHCSFLELLPLVPTCCRWWTWTSGKSYHEGNGNGTATSSSMSHNHDVQISFKVAGTFCRQAAHTDLLVVPAWLPWTLLTKKVKIPQLFCPVPVNSSSRGTKIWSKSASSMAWTAMMSGSPRPNLPVKSRYGLALSPIVAKIQTQLDHLVI